MTGSDEGIRLHVHWIIKASAIGCVLLGAWDACQYLRAGSIVPGLVFAFIVLYSMYIFFLADSILDVDRKGIRIIAPHGEYVLSWDEVTAVEKSRFTTIFFAPDKALAYNLLLAGKGKQSFVRYIDRIIEQRRFVRSRPSGMTNAEIQKLLKKARVRGWKLF